MADSNSRALARANQSRRDRRSLIVLGVSGWLIAIICYVAIAGRW